MAGLMLADTTAGLRERLDMAEARIAELARDVDDSRDRTGAESLPEDFAVRLRALAERSEALADRVEGAAATE